MLRPFAATLPRMGARTRAGGGGYQPTGALDLQARTRAMTGDGGGSNGRMDSGRGVEAGANVELVLQRAARALFLGDAARESSLCC